jgi:hypothetical protein
MVIPTHNLAKLVVRKVAAFLAQVGVYFELIVVDDSSTNDTLGQLARFSDLRLRIVRQNNSRPEAARNAGTASYKGQCVLFNDDYIVPEPVFLLTHLELHRQYANITAVSPIQIPHWVGQDPFTCFWRAQAGGRGKSNGAGLGWGGFWLAWLLVKPAHLPASPFDFKLLVALQSRVSYKGGTSWQGSSLNSDEQLALNNTRLFRKHAPNSYLAVASYTLFWTLEYSLRRRWAGVGALWRGVLSGWRLPIRPIREEQWTI